MSGTAIQIGEPVSGERSLYGRIEELLGVRVASDHDLAKIVETRLPTKVIGSLIRHGLTDSNVYKLVIPRRTLSHRKSRRQKLTREESDRVVRLAARWLLPSKYSRIVARRSPGCAALGGGFKGAQHSHC